MNHTAFNYDEASHRYDNHRQGGGPHIPWLSRLAARFSAHQVVELGPGTGNNTAAFLDAYPCNLIGIELSRNMLLRARAKEIPAMWLQADAASIPLPNACAQLVYAVYVLHHITDLNGVCRECARILHKGAAAFVTSSHDFIRRHPMNRYFPSFSRIDLQRFQDVPEIMDTLKQAGFTHTQVERVTLDEYPIDHAYADKVEGRFISTYDLMPEDEYLEGLRHLRRDIEHNHGRLPEPMKWEAALVWGEV